jgi:hypothetical protein
LARAGYGNVEPILQGSAVTGKSFKTGKEFDVGRVSDFDIALLVPQRVDLKTGEAPPGATLPKTIPDAANFDRGLIVDDKPLGRPIAKDRQEIIRVIEAFRQREGVCHKP